MKTLFLLSFYSRILKDSLTSAPLQSLHMHTVLISPELLNTQTPKGFCLSSFSLRWRIWMPSWLSFCSSNLLLSLQGVQQPCEDPSVDSSSNYRTQRVLFSSLCLSAHYSNAHLAEYLLPERSTVLSSCAPMHPLNAHLAELSESSVILVLLPELTTEFFLCALLALAQCPPGRASQNPQ
jgi:hypothetical protein